MNELTGEALSPPAASALYASDSSAVDMQKYRQLYASAGTGTRPSPAVNLAPSAAAAAAGSSPAVVAAAMKPPAGIITPNIHQPPPALPPYPPPPVQVMKLFTVCISCKWIKIATLTTVIFTWIMFCNRDYAFIMLTTVMWCGTVLSFTLS